MVIFTEWPRASVIQKSSSGLPMTGEDTGLGALTSPLAGYLGKVQERVASLEHCPWCTVKGLTYLLRTYCINLQESITLCTNPQCLFPLVSQPLEDVLASLDPVEPITGNKRKNSLKEQVESSPKRMRSIEDTVLGNVHNGQHAVAKLDEYSGDLDCPVTRSKQWEFPQDEDAFHGKESESADCTDGVTPPTCLGTVGDMPGSSEALSTTEEDEPLLLPITKEQGDCEKAKGLVEVINSSCSLHLNQTASQKQDDYTNDGSTSFSGNSELSGRMEPITKTVDIASCKDVIDIKSETPVTDSEEVTSVSVRLFWKNSDNLCWLDSVLVALVNLKSLRKMMPKDEPQQSPVWRIISGYDKACAAVQQHRQSGTDGVVTVPDGVLQKANADLQSLRMSVFNHLQPKLHCKLGQREMPVFALPLLLMKDCWVEPLFQSTFHWDFHCTECTPATREKVTKTLPTFTNILADWHPLQAAHLAPCNRCHQKNQRRTMMLESVSPVFALHFVEGLPDNDVRIYTFSFKGKCYSITTVIQYNNHLKHFVTWISKSDGSWLEFDDLKHPHCKIHQRLEVPAQEIHIVFWEEEDKEPRVCSPSSTFTESSPSKNEMNLRVDEPVPSAPDHSLLVSPNETDIICALSESGNDTNTDTVTTDTSIGSTTLLDTFEGLTHNDIITLTLVEIKGDAETQPLNDNEQAQNLPSSDTTKVHDPDSSSTVIHDETSHNPEDPCNSSDTGSSDGSSNDPTFVPVSRRGRGRGRGRAAQSKTVGRQKGKKAPMSKAPPESPKVSSNDPVDITAPNDDPTPGETTQQASPVTSPLTSGLPPTRQVSTALAQNARWSYLLSKHPLNHIHNSNAKITPTHTPSTVTLLKPTPTHSTPNPVRRQQPPTGLWPKPQLRTEDSGNLPLKAAEMYGAFGSKNLNAPRTIQSPVPPSDKTKPLNSVSPHVVSGTSLVTPGAKGLLETSSLKKPKNLLSKMPPGLSDTEALRYKLMKKLKAKKKKLAKLDQLLNHQADGSLRPDSTHLGSPSTVTSSTYDGSTCEDFISDLLSPATTASNLSPDSTGFLEMFANGQDGADHLDSRAVALNGASQTNTGVKRIITTATDNFLDEFICQAVGEQPTEMETEALSGLDIFF